MSFIYNHVERTIRSKPLVVLVDFFGDKERNCFLHFQIDVAECDDNDVRLKQIAGWVRIENLANICLLALQLVDGWSNMLVLSTIGENIVYKLRIGKCNKIRDRIVCKIEVCNMAIGYSVLNLVGIALEEDALQRNSLL